MAQPVVSTSAPPRCLDGGDVSSVSTMTQRWRRVAPSGRPVLSVIGFTIPGGKVLEMDILADPDRLSRLDLSVMEP